MKSRCGGKNHRRRQRARGCQISDHAGGRGKGAFKTGFQGGVKVATSADEAVSHAQNMLGNVLVTKQTGTEGRRVQTLLIASGAKIKKEFYLAVLLDRAVGRPLVMASTEGGMDIEEVAAKTPEKIFKEWIDPPLASCRFKLAKSPPPSASRAICSTPPPNSSPRFNTWWECDASLVEINPMCIVELPGGKETVVALDAKISLDDNAFTAIRTSRRCAI